MPDTLNIDPARWIGSSLRGCSLEARGLWSDLLCIMHQGPTRGQLRTDAGTPMGHSQIARICGITTAKAEELVKELEDAGVSQRTDGCISCVWMLKQEEYRTYERDRKRTQRERGRPPPGAENEGRDNRGTGAGTTRGQGQGQTPGQQRGVGGVLSLSGETPDTRQPLERADQTLTIRKNQNQARAQSTEKTKPTSAPSDFPGFERFWGYWPPHHRKTDKAKCLAKWRQLGLELLTIPVLDGLKRWKGSDQWAREGGRFVPAPHAWLNKRLWESAKDLQQADGFLDEPQADPAIEAEAQAMTDAVWAERLKGMTHEQRTAYFRELNEGTEAELAAGAGA